VKKFASCICLVSKKKKKKAGSNGFLVAKKFRTLMTVW
jgi:hypothetical protein